MKNYFSKLNNFNRYSKVITSSKQSGPAQSMLYALGLTKNDINSANYWARKILW